MSTTITIRLKNLVFANSLISLVLLFLSFAPTYIFGQCSRSFTAPADLCIDAGVQAGLGGGTPTGGVYSGPGVTDNGDGLTYSFDPAAAGVGMHMLTYTYTSSDFFTQIGNDIDGEASRDESGFSVSLSSDGNRVAIGATHNDGNSNISGHVRIYDWNGTGWVQVGLDIDGEASRDESGFSVSLSSDGNRVAIGATHNDGNGNRSGHVRIYDWNGTAWIQAGGDIDGEDAENLNGYSVSFSLDANRVAIGAISNDDNGFGSGHVRIFDWNGTAWVQVGLDIDGEAQYEVSGWSVSLSSDGNRVAIGAPGSSGGGRVRIYDWNGTAWVQAGLDIFGEASGDWSGYSVSLSSDGNRVAIGAFRNDDNGTRSGHVRIYDWNGTSWIQAGGDIDGEAEGDLSGTSVSLSSDGNRVAIGAPENTGNGEDSGHVRIYDWNGTDWVQEWLDIDGEAFGDESGFSVSLSSDGGRVAIGAPGNNDNGNDAGHVRIYDLNGLFTCTNSASDDVEVFSLPTVNFTALPDLCINAEVQSGLGGGTPTGGVYSGAGVTDNGNDTYDFDPAVAGVGVHTLTYTYTDSNISSDPFAQIGQDIDGEASSDDSGFSVSLSSDGNRVAVGAPANDGNGSNSGHVRIYEWNGTGWVQVGLDIDGEASSDDSGFSVSLSSDGNRVAIGAPDNDGNGSNSGHVRIYEWNGTAWVQTGLDIDGEASSDDSGFSVSLSSDGNRVAIGAPDNDGNGSNSGHVRIYDWNGTGWVQAGGDIDGETEGDLSGTSVSLSSDGNRVAIGAIENSGSGDESGHVRIYDWNGTSWVQAGGDIDGEAEGDLSGTSVSLSSDGNRVAIGAPENNGNGDESGHVRIYDWNGTAWVQTGLDIDGEDEYDRSGTSVSLSSDGSRVAIGAPENDGIGNADQSGHVRIYEWNGTAWVQTGLDIDGENEHDESGSSVSLSSDGSRVAIGAPVNDGNGTSSGHARIYDLNSIIVTCSNSASDDVEVFALPVVDFTAPADVCVSTGVQMGLGGGTPTGGVYSGPGVTDDGDGLTYSFDPAAAGVGVHTITYTFTDMNGCTDSASDDVEVIDLMFDCPSDTTIQLMPEQCDTIVTFDDPEFTDDCPEATIMQIAGLPSGSVFPIGENIISFEGRDDAGNVDTCTWSIIIEEYVPMGLLCKGEINFSVDEMTCSGSLTPSMLIDVSSVGCADSCTITVTGEDGIKRPADFTQEDIGKTFDYEICCGGICCWGIVNVEYKFKPVIECVESDTLSCTQSFDESLITPDISMSCAEVELITIDREIEYLNCDTMFTAKMITYYTAIDEYGNTSDTCTQTIYLERTKMDSITQVMPFTINNGNALDCGSGFATTSQGYPFPALSVTGAPKLKLDNGDLVDIFPFNSNVICNGFAKFEDEILFGSTNCVTKIKRKFTIGEWWCSKTIQKVVYQYIEVVDFTGPIVNGPDDFTISTANHSCEGYTSFDMPDVEDACNETNIRIDLSAPTSPTGFIKDYNGQIIQLPVGKNKITYHVYDDCGNPTDYSFFVTVQDDADPIAICDQFTVVGFGLETLTKVSAEDIDDGSFDECGPVDLFIARMDAPGFEDLTGFGPDIDITCNDVGGIVMVGLLVRDGGGNTNMCMASIEVQDKIDARFTSCPIDMEVECNFPYDPNNLAAFFGEAEFVDNCPASNTIDDIILGSLNTCGSGELTREIRLLNSQGVEVDFCIQQITFRNGDPLQFSDITPPPSEVTVTGCGIESIDPSILGMPIVPDRECQQASIGIENDTFPFTQNGACLKIIRTFKVIDWCIEDGPGSIYRPFEFKQTIKVNNTIGPDIENVFADSIFCSYEVGCGAININGYLTATSSDDCTASNDLLNRFEVRDSDGQLVNFGPGLDASGTYDVDTYTVRFISEDKCGNQSLAESTFEVRSCKLPTAYCLEGLSATLVAMDTTGDGNADVEMLMIPAAFFDAGSYHPCGYDVQLSFSEDVEDTLMTFFCSDTVGLQPIELWVTDENGGQDYCTTFLDVQDNDTIDLCGGLRPVDITGRIYTEADVELKETEVELKSSESIRTMTDENGVYEFADMPQGGNYQVFPYKDNDHMNGVSTLDLVMIQRHILGIQPLDSPYKQVAADINNDEKLSAADLLALRKSILGVAMSFPNNTSWRFIDSGFEFVNEDYPWETSIDEIYVIENLSQDMKIDFIAVKTGDVNGNVDVNVNAGIVSEVRSNSTMILDLPNQEVERGNIYEVKVKSRDAMNIFGMQHTLELEGLEMIHIIPGKMELRKEHTSAIEGQLHVSYAAAHGDEITADAVLYTMVLHATADGQLSEMISISNRGLVAEFYRGEELAKGTIEISWRAADEGSAIELMNLQGNNPNPWRNITEIEFQLPGAGNVNLILRDVNGRLLMNKSRQFNSGANSFSITGDEVKISGILLYELRYEDQIVNGKMIKIK